VRTFALANMGRHRADGFDLCDQTHCQVVRAATKDTDAAAQATAGRVLLYRGAPASIYYTASCGGRSERPSAVWPGAEDPPFLPSREDPAADETPWTAELPFSSLGRALNAAGFRGTLRDVRVAARSASGRVAALALDGLTPHEISGQDLRVAVGRTLGWQYIKSAAFTVARTSGGVRFAGQGSGHGVGLCVIGSAALAAKGRTTAQILSTYFPGLIVGPGVAAAVPTDVLVSLPAGDEGERSAIVAAAVKARDELVRELGAGKPARLTLRFHPTVDSYTRTTGQEWYTAATAIGDEIQFVPLAVLRERGILDRTIRREIARRLTAPALASRPLWVREGAARYFAEPPAGHDRNDARGRVECPRDSELAQPQSPGALANASARAEACFTRAINAGRKWSDVR